MVRKIGRTGNTLQHHEIHPGPKRPNAAKHNTVLIALSKILLICPDLNWKNLFYERNDTVQVRMQEGDGTPSNDAYCTCQGNCVKTEG